MDYFHTFYFNLAHYHIIIQFNSFHETIFCWYCFHFHSAPVCESLCLSKHAPSFLLKIAINPTHYNSLAIAVTFTISLFNCLLFAREAIKTTKLKRKQKIKFLRTPCQGNLCNFPGSLQTIASLGNSASLSIIVEGHISWTFIFSHSYQDLNCAPFQLKIPKNPERSTEEWIAWLKVTNLYFFYYHYYY